MIVRLIFTICLLNFWALSLGACSGGGGSGSPPTVSAAPATTTPVIDTFCCSFYGPASMGFAAPAEVAAGPIASPPPATFGSSQKRIAAPQGPSFDGSSGSFPMNVAFPLITTSYKNGLPGLSAGPENTTATFTVVSSSANSSTFQIAIPSLNLTIEWPGRSASIVDDFHRVTWGLSYVSAGTWLDDADGIRPLISTGKFLFGYETPLSAMPATGTSSFAGVATGTVYKNIGSTVLETSVDGSANILVNFSSGQVTGKLTQMQQWDGQKTTGTKTFLPWNDVSITAGIANGTSRFSGSTSATSAPGTTFSLAGSATGHVDGALYGPTAQNIGAIWSLSDGTASAIGALTAKQ